MLAAQGDVGALVFTHQLLAAVSFHHGRALHHDPVLGAVVVHLQGKAGARLHFNLFHLPALAFGDAVVMAPGPVDAAMGLALRGPFALELAHNSLDVLGPVAVGHQHHVIGFDYHQIFHAKPHHQPVFAAQVAVAGVFADHPAAQHVAVGIVVGGFPQGAPAAHIAPARLQRQNGPELGALHDSHVEGHVGALGKGFFVQAQEFQISGFAFEGGAAGTHHLRGQPFELGEHRAGLEQKHAAVPGEAAAGEEGFGGGAVGLFDKPGNWHRARGPHQGFGCFDVAIARFRGIGHDAKGHQLAGFSGRDASGDRGAKGGGIPNHVVGGEHQQQRIVAPGGGLQGGHGYGRGGVAADGFQQDGGGVSADLPHLFGHDEAVVFVADQQGRGQAFEPVEPLLGLLQQGFFASASEGPILLGITRPRERPQPGAGATAEDDGDELALGHGGGSDRAIQGQSSPLAQSWVPDQSWGTAARQHHVTP